MIRPPTAADPEHVAPPQSGFLPARAESEGVLRYFGFRETPFGVTPDPEFLFWSEMHRSAFHDIVRSIESNLGFSVLIGEPGTGKTTLLFQLLTQYREGARTAFIFQTQCRPHDLLRHIASELELPCTRRDEVLLHQELKATLIQEARAGRKVIIIVDEAQNLQPSSLEAIRLLSDFETAPCKLLHVVLAGSSRLRETLLSPDLSQLAQRITTISRLEPLTELEIEQYVKFRLRAAGAEQPDDLFSSEALAQLAFQSGGVPRLVNALAYGAVLRAYRRCEQLISVERVNEAARDIDLTELGRTVSSGLQEAEVSGLLSPSNQYHQARDPKKPIADTCISRAKHPEGNLPLNSGDSVAAPANLMSSPQSAESGAPGTQMRGVPVHAHPGDRIKIASRSGIRGSRHTYLSPLSIASVVLLTLSSWMAWTRLHDKFAANFDPSHPKTQESLNAGRPGALISTEKAAHAPRNGENNLTFPLTASDKMQHNAARAQGNQIINLPSDSRLSSRIATRSRNSSELSGPGRDESISTASGSSAIPRFDINPAFPSLETKDERPAQITVPRLEEAVQPDYPAKARLSHIEGEVQLEIAIAQNGRVVKVRPLAGNPLLIQAAELAVLQWRYSPLTQGQLPVPAITHVRFNFKLNPR